MSRVVKAEYDEQSHTLRLLEPVEGLKDHQQVSVVVNDIKPKRPWADLEGILKGEEGESFARAIEEAFPIEPIKK
jgi:hypothetical protein